MPPLSGFVRNPAKNGRKPDIPDSTFVWRRGVGVGPSLALGAAVSLPRQILPDQFYMITRSCTQRMLLLRPDEEFNALFEYCLAVAAAKYKIMVILSCVMSNHHHTVVFDQHGNISEFCEYLHRLVAKATNALRGRRENLWSSEALSLVRLVDAEDVLAKLVYAATNPVKDGLVAKVEDWPGVNTLGALLDGRAIQTTRPKCFFAADGTMPKEAPLELGVPSVLGPADEFRTRLRARCSEAVAAFAAERRREGKTVLGRAAILKQSWQALPDSPREQRDISPTIAARNLVTRIKAIAQYRAFVDAYRDARERWRRGESALFPVGTYWLKRFASVPVADA